MDKPTTNRIATIPTTNEEFRFGTPHARIPVSHGRLAYYRCGQGPDVVAVHGWPLHAATFRRVLPALARRFTVHLIDLPGAGATEYDARVTFEGSAAAIREAMDTVGLRRYALLAHDSGGVIARLVAADDPRVCGLVLMGSEMPGHHSFLLQTYLWVSKIPVLATWLMRAMQIPFLRRSRLAFGNCFTSPDYADGEFARLFTEPLRDPNVVRGHLAILDAFTFDLVDRLVDVHARIQAPTLCVWGERDPIFPVGKARAMLPQFAGGAELVVIPNAKLFPHEDHPDEVARHAIPFLARCLASSTKSGDTSILEPHLRAG
jgi:pimeloyl-ACP methyl ester carboxylesterase